MENWWIHGLLVNAAQGFLVLKSGSPSLKRKILIIHGLGWTAAAALDLWHAFGIHTQRPEVSIAGCLSQLLLASFCLYRGLRPRRE